jgi:hypothetical protein
VAIYAGVGPAGSALFFNPVSAGAAAAGGQAVVPVRDGGDTTPTARKVGTPGVAAAAVRGGLPEPLPESVEVGTDHPGVWLRDGGAVDEAGAGTFRTNGVDAASASVPAVTPVEDAAIVLAAPTLEAPEVTTG